MARRDSTARRYAEAAFEVALRDDTLETWRSDIMAASAIAGDPRPMVILASPAIATERRVEVLQDLLREQISQPVMNLILLLLRRGRIEELPRVAAEFQRLDERRQGITRATATSAAPLGPEEVRALTARLEGSTGGRVNLELRVDPGLLGGLVVRIGDRLIDGSVRGRLERLRNQLISGAL
ncbi:MAG: ATP synthase F1 subunit delta [Candidatus Limnocylindrales bacterium]